MSFTRENAGDLPIFNTKNCINTMTIRLQQYAVFNIVYAVKFKVGKIEFTAKLNVRAKFQRHPESCNEDFLICVMVLKSKSLYFYT